MGRSPKAVIQVSSFEGIGIIGLPLPDFEAHRLTATYHQAPFGRDSETFIDTTVRNTSELNPAHFKLRNPAWQQALDRVVARISTGLGLSSDGSGLRAVLQKLLRYNEGPFVDRHTGDDRPPSLFNLRC